MRVDVPPLVFITSVSPRNGGEDFAVSFEIRSGDAVQKECFLISQDSFIELRPKVGESSPEEYDRIEHASLVLSAVKRALYILGFGSCSEKRLQQKLISKGIDREVAREAMGKISAMSVVDESSDALREAQRCLAKLWGRRRIASALSEKGYPKESVESALYALEDEGVDYPRNAARLIGKKYSVLPSDRAEAGKLFAYLTRYGYSSSEIKEAIGLFAEESGEE